MEFLPLYLSSAVVIWACVTALWILSLVIKDASIIDIFWGAGYVVVAWYYFIVLSAEESFSQAQFLILALVTIWGGRLTIYLAIRNIGKGEDFRYKKWRADNGSKWWWLSYIRVFLLQGTVMWVVALPTLGAMYNNTQSISLIHIVITLIWLIGFMFEAGGDYQLTRFKANPDNKGKVLNTGFWKYTRHPNYFGDAVQWWAFFLLALINGAWFTIHSPIIMTYFLMRISGVAMLERTLKKTKPAYADYIANTPAFFPSFTNRSKSS